MVTPTKIGMCFVDMGNLQDSEKDSLIRSCIALGWELAFQEDEVYLSCPAAQMEALKSQVTKFSDEQGCTVIVAGCFPADRLRQKITLCRYAARIAAKPVIELKEIASTLFFTIMSRCFTLSNYYDEEVIRVMDEDAQRGSTLSRSLFAYLLNFNDLKMAANQIGIHRNTMEYHVKKIESLIGGKLDQRRRFMMLCTYRMLAVPETEPIH